MSKEDANDDRAVRLSPSDGKRISDHINERATSSDDECVVCGSPVNIVSEMEMSVLVQSIENNPINSGLALPVYVTICNNCGFVRMFSKNIVDHLTSSISDDEEH